MLFHHSFQHPPKINHDSKSSTLIFSVSWSMDKTTSHLSIVFISFYPLSSLPIIINIRLPVQNYNHFLANNLNYFTFVFLNHTYLSNLGFIQSFAYFYLKHNLPKGILILLKNTISVSYSAWFYIFCCLHKFKLALSKAFLISIAKEVP